MRFTEAEIKAMVERTCRNSGVPVKLEDPATIEQIVDILRGGLTPGLP